MALADPAPLEAHDQLSPVQNGRTTGRIAAPTAMSIDVEDWFHVENLRGVVSRESWNRRELRVERAMDRMLELMAEHDVKATCFVLGWLAERAPGLVRRLAAAGHEVALYALDVPLEERWARIERRNAEPGVVVISRTQLEEYERWWQRPDDAEVAGYDAGAVTGGPAAR